jgi:RimJ/RimL family protein N-acetyltransferase
MRVEDNGICVRDILPGDAEAYFAIYSHPEVARYDDFEPIDRDELARDMVRIAGYDANSLNREYAVCILPSDTMIGVLTVDKKKKYCYFGYHFHPDYHGRGYAFRAVTLFLKQYKKCVLKDFRVVCDPENSASIKLALKAGFKKVGIRMAHGKKEVIFRFDMASIPEVSGVLVD